MKIKTGGTPITVNPRPTGGVSITQGRSWITVSPAEVPLLLQALEKISREERA